MNTLKSMFPLPAVLVALLAAQSVFAQTPVITNAKTAASAQSNCSSRLGQTVFRTTAGHVWFDFSYTGGFAGDLFSVEFFDPRGALYLTKTFSQPETGSGGCYAHSVPIAGNSSAGAWTAKLLWNGTQLLARQFTVTRGLLSRASVASVTPSPSVFGSLVNITANVHPAAATGTVTFYNGVQVLGHGILAGGTATLSTLALPPGTAEVSAYYNGDGTYGASRSSALPHRVNAVASAALRLQSTTRAPVGATPLAVAVGDFNGDGQADLAVANYGDNTVSILLGDGNGGFTSGDLLASGASPHAVVVGDFNGDGNLDLAVANYLTSTVSVFLGDGNGRFRAANGSPFAAGPSPVHLAAGDFNNDGWVDLAVVNTAGNSLTVLMGDGKGGFSPGQGSPFSVGNRPVWVGVGDFNGDGSADLAVVNSSDSTLSILLGDGSGSFRSVRSVPTPGTNFGSAAIGDFNGDGKADLAVGQQDSVTILLGDGAGGFNVAGDGYIPLASAANYLVLGDFNGDGKADLAIADLDGVTVLFGDGNGGFPSSGKQLLVGGGLKSLVAGDFNGDGRADLAFANGRENQVAVLLGTDVSVATESIPGARSALARPRGNNSLAATAAVAPTVATPRTSAPACTFALSSGPLNGPSGPSSQSFTAAGGNNSLSVFTLNVGCGWTAVSNASWLHVTGSTNAGNGTVTYHVDANPATTGRIGTFTVAGLTFTVLEAGTGQNLSCTISTTALTVRFDGETELTGDLIGQCSGTAGPGAVTADIAVSLNTNVTSRIVDSGVTSEALLLLNDPATPVMNTNAFLGSAIGSSLILFRSIPIVPAGGVSVPLKIRITNVRANANATQLSQRNNSIVALVALSGTSTNGGVAIPLNGSQQIVGNVNQFFSLNANEGGVTFLSASQSQLAINFQEQQANSSLMRLKIAANQDPSQPGVVYKTESGFVNSARLTPSIVGKADTATRMLTRLNNIPAGVHVFAPIFPTTTSPTNAQLVSANGAGAGGTFLTGTTTIGGVSYREIAVDGGGNTSATWEIISLASTASARSLTFNFVLTTDTNTASNVGTKNTIAPIASVTQATATDPIPRFVETQGVGPADISLRTSIAVAVVAQGMLRINVTTINDDGGNTETGTKQITTLPPGITNANCTGPDGKTYQPVGGAVNVPVGNLGPGQTATTTCMGTPSGTTAPEPVIAGSSGNNPNTDPNGGTASAAIPPDPVTVTFATAPPGLIVKDGAGNTLTSITVDQFSSLSFSVSSPQNGPTPVAGVQYAFDHWSDNLSTTSIRNGVMPPLGGGTITAVFVKQYQVTATATTGGTVGLSPQSSGNFYSDGAIITVTATASAGYSFMGFTGDLPSAGNPLVVSWTPGQGKPLHITANFFAASRFITSLYTDLLDRQPDQGGLNFWEQTLSAGTTPAQVASSFFRSPEFSGGGLAIIQYYIAVIGRDPDFGGWFFWFNTYIGGTPLSSILNSFLGSREFTTTYGNLTDAQFVNLVYQNVLGRAPDPGGNAFWQNSLKSGVTRGTMFGQFISSAEFQTKSAPRAYANLLYMGFLRRTAEPGGLAFWTNALSNLAQLPNAINAFITSPEYLARFP